MNADSLQRKINALGKSEENFSVTVNVDETELQTLRDPKSPKTGKKEKQDKSYNYPIPLSFDSEKTITISS